LYYWRVGLKVILINSLKCQSQSNGKKVKTIKNKQKQNGYTLVEAVIAIAITAMVAAIFTNVIAVSLNARNLSRQRLQLIAISTGKLDEIIAKKYTWRNRDGLANWLIDDGFSYDENDKLYSKQETDINNIKYDIKIFVEDAKDGANQTIEDVFQLRFDAKAASGGKNLILTLRLREIKS
jgi:prepilin-type N-terminal cleavage/methylation domain-containing protein